MKTKTLKQNTVKVTGTSTISDIADLLNLEEGASDVLVSISELKKNANSPRTASASLSFEDLEETFTRLKMDAPARSKFIKALSSSMQERMLGDREVADSKSNALIWVDKIKASISKNVPKIAPKKAFSIKIKASVKTA